MKKLRFGIIVSVTVIAAFIILFSCKKEMDSEKKYVSSHSTTEFIPASEDVIPLIKKFKAMNAGYENGIKTQVDMPLEQALWTLEATANYDFASERDSTTDFVYDSLIVYIDSYYDDDTLYLDGESIMEAYDDLYDFIYEQVTAGSNIRLIAGDLSVVNITSTTTTIRLICVTGPFVTGDYSINSTDYWYAANELGKCGDYIGQQIGKDASNRIHQVLNWNHGMAYACANGGVVFFTSIDEIDIEDGTNGWYFWNGPSPNDCLDPADMVYWVDVAEDEIEAQRPTAKAFIDVEFLDDLYYPTSTWVHVIRPVRYGIINCTNPEE